MPRGKRKFTRDEMIEKLTKEIEEHQIALNEKQSQLNELIVEQKKERYEELDKVIEESGKSIDQIISIVKKAK